MSLTAEQIRTAALELQPAEREALAEELLLSISGSERYEIDAAWLEEVQLRDAAFIAGKMSGSPVDEAIEDSQDIHDASRIAAWAAEIGADASRLPSEEHTLFSDALLEIERESKAAVRRE